MKKFIFLIILLLGLGFFYWNKSSTSLPEKPLIVNDISANFPLYLIISAPSGCGKSVIMNKLTSQHSEFYRVISATTREKRSGEVDGVDYYYLSVSDFDNKLANGEFLEYTEVYGNKYGIYKKDIDQAHSEGKVIMFDVDERGMTQLKSHLESKGLRVVTVYILPPSLETLRKRLEGRNTDSSESIEKRMSLAKEKMSFYPFYDYPLVNDNIDVVISKLLSIADAERMKTTSYRYYVDQVVKNESNN